MENCCSEYECVKFDGVLSAHQNVVLSFFHFFASTALALRHPPDHLFCVKVASGKLYLIIANSDAERNEWLQAIKPLCRRKRKDEWSILTRRRISKRRNIQTLPPQETQKITQIPRYIEVYTVCTNATFQQPSLLEIAQAVVLGPAGSPSPC